jgi:predicted nucleic-acid-binding protein
MTGIDTNILLRFSVADDPVQSRKVYLLFQSFTAQSPGYIALVCLAEYVWVLTKTYSKPKSVILGWVRHLLTMPQLVFENQEAVEQALQVCIQTNAGFSDCLIERAGHIAGCTSTVTFDKGAAKASGMRLL